MAQKTNPLSLRLGTIQIWNSSIQIYGKSFNSYFQILHKFLNIQNFLHRLFYRNNFLLIYQEGKIYKNNIVLNLYYSYLPYSSKYKSIEFFNKIVKDFFRWFKITTSVHFYLQTQNGLAINLVIAYCQNLLQQNLSAKKVLWSICKLLEIYINSYKLSYFKNGFMRIHLRGFKIRLSGRLDGAKSQMANSIEQTIGSLPLNYLKSYIEYKNQNIYTKSGICGLQIWLFYELKEFNNVNN